MSISLKNVYYTYDRGTPAEKEALRDRNLIFNDHCFTALIGRTGSGKSTLIQHLNGLLLPDSGIVDANGYVIDRTLEYKKNGKVDVRARKKKHKKKQKDIKRLRKRVGLVFQFPEYQIFEDSVVKDVSYGPKNFGRSEEEAKKEAKTALRRVGLDESFDERSPFELSGGEKRRVAIAGILALKPDVLVLDEPTVGLDAKGEKDLRSLLVSLHEKGTSIILATHNRDVVLSYCDRAIVLNYGEIVKDCTPLELFRDSEFREESFLEPPKVFRFALDLKSRGIDIDLNRIKDTSSLAEEIVRVKGGK